MSKYPTFDKVFTNSSPHDLSCVLRHSTDKSTLNWHTTLKCTSVPKKIPQFLGSFGSKVPDNYCFFLSFTFGNKNTSILQLGNILNNEASLLQSLFQIFSMPSWYSSKFSTIPKIINQCLTSLGTNVVPKSGYANQWCPLLVIIFGKPLFLDSLTSDLPEHFG